MPHPMPFANVFSIGDVLIAVGVGIVIAVAMTAPRLRGGPPRLRRRPFRPTCRRTLPPVVEAS